MPRPSKKKLTKESSQLGFTMIELLVVLIIVSLTASLVGPSMFHRYEKIKARDEEQRLFLLLDAVGMQAFLSQTARTIDCRENQISLVEQKETVDFTYLTFPATSVYFNANGFAESPALAYRIGEEEKSVSLE